jgi:hypothetical protein
MNVGKCFHSYRNGKLLRRGVVIAQNATSYRVWFVDPLSGLLNETGRIPIANTKQWEWFCTRAESDAAYERHFATKEVNHEEVGAS